MPALPIPTGLASTSLLAFRDTATTLASNGTSREALKVICAWPVSGQYGPGSRVLYDCSTARPLPVPRCCSSVLRHGNENPDQGSSGAYV